MNRIILYAYDPKNLEQIVDEVASKGLELKIMSPQEMNLINTLAKLTAQNGDNSSFTFNSDYYDLSLIMAGDSERIDLWSSNLVSLLNMYLQYWQEYDDIKYFIVDKKYAKDICSALPYFIEGVDSLEKKFGIDKRTITNIVDLDSTKVDLLESHLNQHLFGNSKFRARLIQELKRFRIFNTLGERKVFSAFLCGPSGIGKTLTAKLLHDFLAPGEKYIKINLGNYSDHNALSSLIGSPRGYIGSSKGELSSKIEESKSTVILIDEFEKASREVHNFFLELLSDGRFTDSQGREFDLNKYILIFTSNISEVDLQSKISPELRSRFDLMYKMIYLNNEDKNQYIQYKSNYYLEKIYAAYGIQINIEDIVHMVRSKAGQLNNIRIITREIELCVASVLEDKLCNTGERDGEE